jgi:tetratricopeptide (TPR) repeat protein
VARLAEREARSAPAAAAAAAFERGQLHYARGEYEQAAEAFARVARRREGSGRGDARWHEGLARLALRQPDAAERAFTEAVRLSPERRALARLGRAYARELAGRPEAAAAELAQLLAEAPGEAGPPALERLAALSDRLKRPAEAARAREALRQRWPRSVEAARLGWARERKAGP